MNMKLLLKIGASGRAFNMELIEVKSYALKMDRDEIKKLKYVLDYAWHQAAKHESPITEYLKFIEYVRAKLERAL